MRYVSVPACVLTTFFSGGGLLRLASQATLHPAQSPGPHHAWPLAMMGIGLLLAGAAYGARAGLSGRSLAFHRATHLTLLGGLTVGTTLVLLGLLASLTTML
jgi:hypothetical protein